MLNDPQFDIKLFTISHGNIAIKNATRNMCHILDLLDKDIPVVVGYDERLGGSTEDAAFLHGEQGLGGYTPPKNTKHKPLKKDCADAMYEVLKENPKETTLIILGPHTNAAHLFMKYPDAKDMIKNIIMMGGAPYGTKQNPNHCSFNIRVDVPAFKETLKTNLPVVMCPSSIGRDKANFTEEQVNEIQKTNNLGEFLVKTYETYYEPGYAEKIVATNDISAVYYLTHPKLYKTKKAFIEVNEKGKITAHDNRKGNFTIVVDVKRKKLMKMFFEKLREMSDIKIKLK